MLQIRVAINYRMVSYLEFSFMVKGSVSSLSSGMIPLKLGSLKTSPAESERMIKRAFLYASACKIAVVPLALVSERAFTLPDSFGLNTNISPTDFLISP